MNTCTIDNLASISFTEIYNAFQQAFADYKIQIDQPSLVNMLKHRGYNPELPFGAFDNGKLVSFIFR
jgi:hypothetical protein